MSVEVKNTVFSFITQRTPQSAKDTVSASINVFHPNLFEKELSYFVDLFMSPEVNSKNQTNAAKLIAADFKEKSGALINSVTELKSMYTELYNFSDWFIENKESIVKGGQIIEELENMIAHLGALALYDRFNVWNNLFYYMIVDENPYLREKLINLLIADKFINETENPNRNGIAGADVIIPAQLFGFKFTELLNTQSTSKDVVSVKDAEALNRKIAIANAKTRVDSYQTLLTEVLVWQKKYQQLNAEAFNTAEANYKQYLNTLFIENRVLVNETETKPEYYKLPITVDVDPFSFTPAVEINNSILEEELSIKSLGLANQLALSSCSTIESAIAIIKDKIAEHTAQIFSNVEFTQPVLISNGFVLNTTQNKSILPYLYNCNIITKDAMSGGGEPFYLRINLSNTGITNPRVVKIDCEVAIGTKNFSTNVINSQTLLGSDGVRIELFNSSISEINNLDTSFDHEASIRGELTLSNGSILIFGPIVTSEIIRDNSEAVDTGYESMLPKVGDDDSGDSNALASIKPSGHGIRRLGIADYRRVDQTLCCYVPGEVSNIENVMAGEYKERSTRRLRRSEDTTVTEKQTEQENLTDTSTTERYQMQQQSAMVHNENLSASAGVSANFSTGIGSISTSGNIASSSSTSQSNSQAVSYGKDVTQKALERVVVKTREERTLKIIEEFEEANKHGLDNRKNDSHISGVYRWVDAKYKNQIINYGKRLMYEFMIPEPAVFHNMAMEDLKNNSDFITISRPIDPRKSNDYSLKDFKGIDEATAAHWAGLFNAEIEAAPVSFQYIGKSYSSSSKNDGGGVMSDGFTENLDIPTGFKTVSASIRISGMRDGNASFGKGLTATVGDYCFENLYNNTNSFSSIDVQINNYTSKIPVSGSFCSYHTASVNISIRTERLAEHYAAWQIKTFNTIIAAYERKVDEYNAAVADAQSQNNSSTNNTNPQFFRQMENIILRKNCIHYLLDGNPIVMGNNYYTYSNANAKTLQNLLPNNNAAFDIYSNYARFLEQAFEWNIMSYEFLPFYWGSKDDWTKMYRNDVVDPLFHSFLQAGMARVVVTVRPGFEKAVMYFMATGKPWDGGTAPVLDDPMFIAISQDLKVQESVVEETWVTTVPTTLTALQNGTVAIEGTGLPCNCTDISSLGTDITGTTTVKLMGV